jgi:hypothetical protein
MQWRPVRQLCEIPFVGLYGLFGPLDSVRPLAATASDGFAAHGDAPAAMLPNRAPWLSMSDPVSQRQVALKIVSLDVV